MCCSVVLYGVVRCGVMRRVDLCRALVCVFVWWRVVLCLRFVVVYCLVLSCLVLDCLVLLCVCGTLCCVVL